MSWSISARLVTGRRIAMLVVAVVCLIGAGLVIGSRFSVNAAIIGEVSAADTAKDEGDAGTAQMVFAVTASGIVLSPETVYYRTVDGTANAGDDYRATSGTLTFNDSGTQNVTVLLNGDTVVEPSETLTLELREVNEQGPVIDTATGTITNDDFSLSIGNATVEEGNSGPKDATLTITLDGGPRPVATTVQYSTEDATATAPADYAQRSAATATIGAGATSVPIKIPIAGDALFEDTETFTVTMFNPSPATTLAKPSGTVTITNDDPPPGPSQRPKISIEDKSFVEGNSGSTVGNFVATLSAPANYTVSAKVSTSDGADPGGAKAASDYEPFTDATITFAPGKTKASLPVTIKGDALDEFDETFTVTLSNPSDGASIDDTTAVGTIEDDDDTPSLAVANATGNEGAKVTFTITLSRPSGRDTVLRISTSNDTAGSADYAAVTGASLTIEAGQTSKTFDVDTTNDSLDEADETFKLNVAQQTNPAATQFGPPVVATGTIKDATNNTPALSIADVTKAEGNSGATNFDFIVTLAPASGQAVTVNYTAGLDSGSAAATPGVDFTPATGTLTFAPGETTKTATVPVTGDAVGEDDETFKVTLSGAQNATLADGSAIGTITNDDGAVVRFNAITTGAGAGGGSHVRLFDNNGKAAGPGFFGTVNGPGVRVARGDLDGDGRDEIIVSSGPGGPSLVRVFTSDGSGFVAEIEAYPGFSGGVSVAAADIDGDNKDEIVTGALAGGGPHVRTFDLTGEAANRSLVGTPGFYGSQRAHTGGINVAAGDTDGDGKAEIITAIASNGQPAIGVFRYNPATNEASQVGLSFLAFDAGFSGGVNIAAGDLDGDDRVEIVAGAGPGGAPHVRAFSPVGGGYDFSLYAYGAGFSGGVQVAVGDINGDGQNEVVTGVGAGGGPHVRAFNFDNTPLPTSFYAYGDNFNGGVFVAVGKP